MGKYLLFSDTVIKIAKADYSFILHHRPSSRTSACSFSLIHPTAGTSSLTGNRLPNLKFSQVSAQTILISPSVPDGSAYRLAALPLAISGAMAVL